MKKFLLALFVLGLIMFGYLYAMFTGPHMIEQPYIKAYERVMPLPPEGVVPVEKNEKKLPDAKQAALMINPLPGSPANVARGKVYYEYYCVFCHGDSGRGDGPVGMSYMPKPADLHDSAIVKMKDGELFRAMLSGTGHSPVLERVVPSEHRWYLVLYVRAIASIPAK